MKIETALKYTRYNSGMHFLDSGGDNGRIWQQNSPERDVWHDGFDEPGTMSLTHILAKKFEFTKAHRGFYNWLRHNESEQAWMLEIEDFFSQYGFWQRVARDNTFNGENDLDQNFIWEVWQAEHLSGEDWVYGESNGTDYQLVLQVHTGADIRGGYSAPMFVSFDSDEYILPMDLSCQYHSDDVPEDENENWQTGYSSYPYGQIEQAGYVYESTLDDKRTMIFTHNEKPGRFAFTVELPWELA